MPEENLIILKPLLSVLAKPSYKIEPASPEEVKMTEEKIERLLQRAFKFCTTKKVKYYANEKQ
jgi:hypothetical protein